MQRESSPIKILHDLPSADSCTGHKSYRFLTTASQLDPVSNYEITCRLIEIDRPDNLSSRRSAWEKQWIAKGWNREVRILVLAVNVTRRGHLLAKRDSIKLPRIRPGVGYARNRSGAISAPDAIPSNLHKRKPRERTKLIGAKRRTGPECLRV